MIFILNDTELISNLKIIIKKIYSWQYVRIAQYFNLVLNQELAAMTSTQDNLKSKMKI